jgi:hypothetical protein
MQHRDQLDAAPTWRIAGPYFESCNCEAICPCRMIDGKPGSRAMFRYCQFAIGWYEVVMDRLEVTGGGLDFAFEGRCGFAASFDYRSD